MLLVISCVVLTILLAFSIVINLVLSNENAEKKDKIKLLNFTIEDLQHENKILIGEEDIYIKDNGYYITDIIDERKNIYNLWVFKRYYNNFSYEIRNNDSQLRIGYNFKTFSEAEKAGLEELKIFLNKRNIKHD